MDRDGCDNSGDEWEMVRACKICLKTDIELQRVTSWELRDAYKCLTGIAWEISGRLPQHVCEECGGWLHGAARLRRKALGSLRLMNKILITNPDVTTFDIRVARNPSLLKSKKETEKKTVIPTKCDKQTNTDFDVYLKIRKRKTYSNRKQRIKEQDNMDNARKETRSANDACDTGRLEKVVDTAVAKTYDYDSDDSEGVLVIDESVDTDIGSKDDGNGDAETPIDELIDIYNNNGDGDGRLQELNEHFGEENTQIDQSWGAGREAGEPRPRPVPDLLPLGDVETTETDIFEDFRMTRSVGQNTEEIPEDIYRCKLCVNRYDNISAYKSHLRRRHLPATACALCGSTFTSAAGLARHTRAKHPDKDQVAIQGPRCEPCNVRFASQKAYTRHLPLSSRHGPYFYNNVLNDKPRDAQN